VVEGWRGLLFVFVLVFFSFVVVIIFIAVRLELVVVVVSVWVVIIRNVQVGGGYTRDGKVHDSNTHIVSWNIVLSLIFLFL
jgi:hypothetical protein